MSNAQPEPLAQTPYLAHPLHVLAHLCMRSHGQPLASVNPCGWFGLSTPAVSPTALAAAWSSQGAWQMCAPNWIVLPRQKLLYPCGTEGIRGVGGMALTQGTIGA